MNLKNVNFAKIYDWLSFATLICGIGAVFGYMAEQMIDTLIMAGFFFIISSQCGIYARLTRIRMDMHEEELLRRGL